MDGNSLVRRAAARLGLRSPQAAGARQKVDGLEVQAIKLLMHWHQVFAHPGATMQSQTHSQRRAPLQNAPRPTLT